MFDQGVNLAQTQLAVAMELDCPIQDPEILGDLFCEQFLQVAVVSHDKTGPVWENSCHD